MERGYKADLKKASKHGYDPEYTGLLVEDGIVVSCGRGTHYAGCSCRLDNRTKRCTQEIMNDCIEEIIQCLSDEDAVEVRHAKLPDGLKNKENYENRE